MEKTRFIKGIVIPCDWDSKHNIVGIAISAAGEREYEIVSDGMGKSLLKHIHQQVRLEGVVTPSKRNTGKIKVSSYELLDFE